MTGLRSTLIHPRSVPILEPGQDVDEEPDQSFAEGARDELDPALRYRMISERAYHRYVDRGYVDGGDLDDWLQAEADVEHMLLNEAVRRRQGA
jgi:hypothetical protein